MFQELNIFRVTSMPAEKVAGSLYILKNAVSGNIEFHAVSTDGLESMSNLTREQMISYLETYVPVKAQTLQTPRKITATGDADWEVTFDGSAHVSSNIVLKATGVAAGTFGMITLDAKGRATAARQMVAGDIPMIPGSKINSALSVDTSGNSATATLAEHALSLAVPAKINGVDFDGSAPITINAEDAVARIAATEKGAPNGVAPLDVGGLIPVSFLPSFVDDVIEVDDFDKLPGRPLDPLTNGPASKGKIYVVVTGSPEAGIMEIYRWSGTTYIKIPSGVGISDSAVKLATARTISITGDASWLVSFDGSTNVVGSMTLAPTGVTPGQYATVAVDGKGRVTSGRDLIEADLPDLTYTKVKSAATIVVIDPQW